MGFEKVKRYPMREENLRFILAGAVVHYSLILKIGLCQSKAELATAENEQLKKFEKELVCKNEKVYSEIGQSACTKVSSN